MPTDEVLDIQQRDDDYLSAVNRGDMRTAQRMVDEAAEKASIEGLQSRIESAEKRLGAYKILQQEGMMTDEIKAQMQDAAGEPGIIFEGFHAKQKAKKRADYAIRRGLRKAWVGCNDLAAHLNLLQILNSHQSEADQEGSQQHQGKGQRPLAGFVEAVEILPTPSLRGKQDFPAIESSV